jgi:threonine/homoserine/homoserine lactone efflux protein
MWPYLLLGVTFSFAAVVQPGPLQSFLVNQSLARGWRRTAPAALAPLISDGPIMALVLLVLTRIPSSFVRILHAAGGLFLLYLAAGAYRTWRRSAVASANPAGHGRQTLARAILVNLLNPNPYLGWSLVMGPTFLRGWREAPTHGLALLAGFYVTMVGGLLGTIVLASAAGRLGTRAHRALLGLSALALLGFALYQLAVAGKEVV